MSATGYQNQEFVNETHSDIQEQEEQRIQQIEEADETRAELEGDPEPTKPFEMTPGRQIGVVMHNIDGWDEPLEFGKPSGRATKTMLGPIQRMEQEGSSLSEMSEYVWGLLGEWSVDVEKDYDFWADETSMIEATQLARSVAMGGNPQTLRG